MCHSGVLGAFIRVRAFIRAGAFIRKSGKINVRTVSKVRAIESKNLKWASVFL